MRLERLNNLPLNTVTPNFVAIFVFFGTASSFTERISFSEIETKRETILFLLGCSEVNSTWIITSGLANQGAPKALFTCVVYTNMYYLHSAFPCNVQKRITIVYNLRAPNCKYQKFYDRREISDFILFHLNVPFDELFSKNIIKSPAALSFF